MRTLNKQHGLSLVELMIGIVVGLFVVGATITTYMLALRGSADAINNSRLNQELRSSVTQIANELRRAGYRQRLITGGAVTDVANPAAFSAVAVLNSGRCIVYAYDQPNLGTQGQLDLSDVSAFRFVNNQLEIGSNVNPADCTGTFEPITNPARVNISDAVFTTAQANLNASRCRNLSLTANDTWRLRTDKGTLQACDITNTNETQEGSIAVPATNALLYETRVIGIRITGNLTGTPANTATVEESVKIMNDRMFRKP